MERVPLDDLLRRYGGAVPRYTSYPSAVQFTSGFTASPLERLDSPIDASIYLHFPFCRSLCSYCGCMMRVATSDEAIDDYLRSLEEEIRLAGILSGRAIRARRIHFGGGSPNLLSGKSLERIIDVIEENFGIVPGAEIALEADPRRMTAEKALDYAAAGVSRISLGVQDFQQQTQVAINRVQPYELIESCTEWLRHAGIAGINFDLMYGLPYQTVASIADNAAKAAALAPDRISVFGYAHVPWMRPHQKVLERHPLPDMTERYLEAEAMRESLLERGYIAVGMDHFAKPGDSLAAALAGRTLHRNFQGYTTDDCAVLLGLGISSISRYPDMYVQNTANFRTYKETIASGKLPVERGCAVRPEDRLRAEIIESMMCYQIADVAEICHKHGVSPASLALAFEKLGALVADGIVERKGDIVRVTEQGRPFMRTVCSVFDAYYERVPNRHASAV
jgi:oxygen-independent coproporphyrinogen III oxidase